MTGNATTPIPAFTGSFRENLEALVGVLERGDKDPAGKTIGFELERILIDRTGTAVPFEGERGVGALIAKLVELMEMLDCTVMTERTMIPLGSRFGQRNLVMSAEEQQMLVMECEALKSLLET